MEFDLQNDPSLFGNRLRPQARPGPGLVELHQIAVFDVLKNIRVDQELRGVEAVLVDSMEPARRVFIGGSSRLRFFFFSGSMMGLTTVTNINNASFF